MSNWRRAAGRLVRGNVVMCKSFPKRLKNQVQGEVMEKTDCWCHVGEGKLSGMK